jgi:peptidoglycan/LPS O-acetylase OafA/YrhL
MQDSAGRITELDGLRGLAALAVVIAHYFGEVPSGFRLFTFGWLGVDVFFVLSGFLIGSIILEHREKPGFFTAFYMRRAMRILPIYFVTLASTFTALALLGGAHAWIDPPLPFVAYATFSQNFAMVMHGATGSEWLVPTWTLAVEEQFYLLSPLVLFLLPERRILPFLLIGIGLAVGFRLWLIATDALWTTSLVLLPSRLDLLLSGVLGSWLLRTGWANARNHDLVLRSLPLICIVALIPIVAIDASTGSQWSKVFAPLLIGIGAASYILATTRGAPEGRHLRAPWLVFLGAISYGLYLIHQPIVGLLHGLILDGRPDIATPAQLAVTLLALTVSVGVAWLSWRTMEAPLVRFGRRWSYGNGSPGLTALQAT